MDFQKIYHSKIIRYLHDLDTTNLFIEFKHNFNKQKLFIDENGKDIMDVAIETSSNTLVNELIKYNWINENKNYIHYSTKFKDITILKQLLAYDASKINDIEPINGNTALHEACKNKSIDMVNVLIQYGANPNSLNIQNQTPLFLALRVKNETEFDASFKIVSILIESNTQLNIADIYGFTALDLIKSNLYHKNYKEKFNPIVKELKNVS